MNAFRLRLATLVLVTLGAVGCRGTSWFRSPVAETAPVVFTGPPTLNDVVRVINSNTAPIRQLHAEGASISASGYPPLRANLEFEKPRRFRMRAQLLGPELDLGSNDELFWFWMKHSPQPLVYFARHEQFARSPAKQMLPIDPLWLTEAMGVVELNPMGKFEGPFPAGQNRVMIRYRLPTPEGEQLRTYTVHDQYGWILEQHVYDPRGVVIASARGSRHRHYPGVNVSLPSQVDIQIPAAQLSITVSVSGYQFNNLYGDPAQLWSLPRFEGYQVVDIADPNNRFTPNGMPAAMPASAPPGMLPNAPYPPATTTLGNPPPATGATAVPYAPPQPSYRLNQRGVPSTRR